MLFLDMVLEHGLDFRSKKGSYTEHELHYHDILEIHILKRNEACFQLAHRTYEGKPGDVFLFRPFEPHWNLAKARDKPIEWIGVLFSPALVRHIPYGSRLLAPFYAIEAVSPLLLAQTEEAAAIHRHAELAIREGERRQLGWESRQFACLIEILIEIVRYAEKHVALETGEAWESGIVPCIEYLLHHYTEAVDMKLLVERSGKQHTAFYNHFKRVTGVTPHQFIHKLRIQTAVYLLQHTSSSITDIAFECGYSTLELFDRHFHRILGASPRQFRKAAKQDAADEPHPTEAPNRKGRD